MTAHVPTVDCDECGFTALGLTHDSVETLRARLALRLAWSVRDGDGEIDLCGSCCHRLWPLPELTAKASAGVVDDDPVLVLTVPRREVLR